MSRSGSRKSKPAPKPKVAVAPKPVVVAVRARRSTKTARRSPLARTARTRPGPQFRPLPLEEDKRQHLEPQELIDFFKQLPAPKTGGSSKSLVHETLPPPSATYWRTYFFLQFFYGLKVSEPALVKESDFKKPGSAKAKIKAKLKIRRLKKGRDPIDNNAQREARAKALRKGVRRVLKDAGGFDEYVYEPSACVVEAIQQMQAWKKTARKKNDENPFLFASERHRKNTVVGIERQSQLRNVDGWQSVSRFTVNRVYRKLATEAKWPEHLRECRSIPALKHTRAVFLLAAGVPIEEVRILLGHSPKMTERYLPVANALREKFGANAFAAFGKDVVKL